MRHSNVPWILLAACFVLSPLGALAETAPDAERLWTTVGSAGTLDEKSEGKVFFDHAVVQKGDTFVISPLRRQVQTDGDSADATDSAVIRYNVTAVDGLFTEHLLGMTVRFLAEGGSARVVAQLVEVNLATGAEVTRLTFDSDNSAAQSGYHVDTVFADCSKQPFDFVKNAYYIDATLTTSSIQASSAAGIEIIQLDPTPGLR